MKAIIKKQRYDTSSATKVADYSNGRGRSDFHGIEETLYVTKGGNWFLEYWGGAASQYREACGQNGWCGSKGILALTKQQAYEWLELHQEADAIESHFPDEIVDA